MLTSRMKQRRVVHKSTAGILTTIPEAVDLVGNSPPGLTNNTVALPVIEPHQGEVGRADPPRFTLST